MPLYPSDYMPSDFNKPKIEESVSHNTETNSKFDEKENVSSSQIISEAISELIPEEESVVEPEFIQESVKEIYKDMYFEKLCYKNDVKKLTNLIQKLTEIDNQLSL